MAIPTVWLGSIPNCSSCLGAPSSQGEGQDISASHVGAVIREAASGRQRWAISRAGFDKMKAKIVAMLSARLPKLITRHL
ncbi:hypothetical protein PG984_005278 [Apiospora sp. TS-2023a]